MLDVHPFWTDNFYRPHTVHFNIFVSFTVILNAKDLLEKKEKDSISETANHKNILRSSYAHSKWHIAENYS